MGVLLFLSWLCFGSMLFSVLMLRRNKVVAAYRRELLDRVANAGRDDINNGRRWEWRYAEYESVSYEEMMRCFWVSDLDDFYDDMRFAQMGVTEKEEK
jgi:hypothetical protein